MEVFSELVNISTEYLRLFYFLGNLFIAMPNVLFVVFFVYAVFNELYVFSKHSDIQEKILFFILILSVFTIEHSPFSSTGRFWIRGLSGDFIHSDSFIWLQFTGSKILSFSEEVSLSRSNLYIGLISAFFHMLKSHYAKIVADLAFTLLISRLVNWSRSLKLNTPVYISSLAVTLMLFSSSYMWAFSSGPSEMLKVTFLIISFTYFTEKKYEDAFIYSLLSLWFRVESAIFAIITFLFMIVNKSKSNSGIKYVFYLMSFLYFPIFALELYYFYFSIIDFSSDPVTNSVYTSILDNLKVVFLSPSTGFNLGFNQTTVDLMLEYKIALVFLPLLQIFKFEAFAFILLFSTPYILYHYFKADIGYSLAMSSVIILTAPMFVYRSLSKMNTKYISFIILIALLISVSFRHTTYSDYQTECYSNPPDLIKWAESKNVKAFLTSSNFASTKIVSEGYKIYMFPCGNRELFNNPDALLYLSNQLPDDNVYLLFKKVDDNYQDFKDITGLTGLKFKLEKCFEYSCCAYKVIKEADAFPSIEELLSN